MSFGQDDQAWMICPRGPPEWLTNRVLPIMFVKSGWPKKLGPNELSPKWLGLEQSRPIVVSQSISI